MSGPVGCSSELVMCWPCPLRRSVPGSGWLPALTLRSWHAGLKAAAPGLSAFTEISIPAVVWPPSVRSAFVEIVKKVTPAAGVTRLLFRLPLYLYR